MESFRDLQRLVAGFQGAKVVLTALELDLFSALQDSAEPVALARRCGADARALTILLNALVALGLVEQADGTFRNAPVARQHLVRGEHYRGHIFEHIHHCWDAWSRLSDTVRRGAPPQADEDQILGGRSDWTEAFIRGMDDVTRELAPHVVPQLPLAQARVLLDVGGGPGTYAAAFLAAYPQLQQVRLFDLPDALAVGRRMLAAKGLAEQVQFLAGDLHHDGFTPAGAAPPDAIWISQVLHALGEDQCQALIAKAVAALAPGGRLLIHEFLLDASMAAPRTAALFAVHMLVMTRAGRSYGEVELSAWLAAAGLEQVTVLRVSDDTAVVTGCKPAA